MSPLSNTAKEQYYRLHHALRKNDKKTLEELVHQFFLCRSSIQFLRIVENFSTFHTLSPNALKAASDVFHDLLFWTDSDSKIYREALSLLFGAQFVDDSDAWFIPEDKITNYRCSLVDSYLMTLRPLEMMFVTPMEADMLTEFFRQRHQISFGANRSIIIDPSEPKRHIKKLVKKSLDQLFLTPSNYDAIRNLPSSIRECFSMDAYLR